MALDENVAEVDRLIESRFRGHELAEAIESMPGIGHSPARRIRQNDCPSDGLRIRATPRSAPTLQHGASGSRSLALRVPSPTHRAVRSVHGGD